MSKTPKLRFKEFSGDWETQKAKELFESISDKNHNGDLEVLSATQDRGVIPRSELNIDIKYEQNNLTSYKKVKESDFIISLRSFQGGIEHSHYTGLVSPAYTVFNFKNNIDSNHRFFAEIFKTQNFINRLNTLTYGIRDGKAISFKDFSDVKLSFPSKEEQEKIASFFSLIDEKISLQGEKLKMLKDYKTGMMQKIFSRKLRFKNDEGRDYPEWEEKKFKDFTKINQGLQIPISERYTTEGENRYFYITNEFLKSDSETKYYIENPSESVICYEDDILMTRTGNTGKVVTGVKGAFHNNFFKIAYDKEKYDRMFLYYILTSHKMQKNIIRLAGSSTIPDLNHSDFYNIKVKLPIIEEQKKIADLLIRLDSKISKEQEKLDSLNEYKKGLLQQMFV